VLRRKRKRSGSFSPRLATTFLHLVNTDKREQGRPLSPAVEKEGREEGREGRQRGRMDDGRIIKMIFFGCD